MRRPAHCRPIPFQSAPASTRRCGTGAVYAGWLAWLCIAGSACSFTQAKTSIQQNACQTDNECASGSQCKSGLCVMPGAPVATSIALSLEVTPKRMPDGSSPIPMVFGPFTLDGPPRRNFDLILPLAVAGRVHDAQTDVPANLSFVPSDTHAQQNEALHVGTTDASAPGAGSFHVQLLPAITYHVSVEPTDTTRPAYRFDWSLDSGTSLDIDYATLQWKTRHFVVNGAPTDRKLMVRALDKTTGVAVSNTAEVSAAGLTLLMAPDATSFRLEITAQQSDASAAQNPSACPDPDVNPSVFPVLTVDDTALGTDSHGDGIVALPQIPAPIRYSGVVKLCSGQSVLGQQGLPLALNATALTFTDNAASVKATYNASVTAMLDKTTGELPFCMRVLPGSYLLVVTPPASLTCGIFAERRSIAAPSGGGDINDAVVQLQPPAVLTGTIETPDGTALSSASVDALALGRDLVFAADDPSVASYNRSKQATSDAKGMFQVPVDLGVYDVVIKPAAGSGFAWQVLYDVEIAARRNTFATRVTLDSPVLVQGTLHYLDADARAQTSLVGAEVHAYTTVTEAGSKTRSIEVGRSTADDTGQVTLLIAPNLKQGW